MPWACRNARGAATCGRASTPIRAAGYPAKPPTTRIELRGVSVGQLMTALRFSGLVISNDEGTLVIHQQEKPL